MPFRPYLILNRLLVVKNGKAAYDERFHAGVNIIRGKNSSGKSTIADFIFYALGGDLYKWKTEAHSCDYVFAEVNLSGSIFTLKRAVRDTARAGMDIMALSLDEAIKSDITSWLRYPYQAGENKESFYQVILKELGIPVSKSVDNNSLTMHQLLRIMYVDQMTSLDRLFKFDQFDSPNKRKAIGELILGISTTDLYEYRVRYQKLNAILDAKIREIKTLHAFLGIDAKNIEYIDSEINVKKDGISSLQQLLASLDANEEPSDDDGVVKVLKDDFLAKQKEFNDITNQITLLKYDIADSQIFVSSLEQKIDALINSSRVISALSDISFQYCPSCFTPTHFNDEASCLLCGSSNEDLSDEQRDPTFKIKKEIEFQISESTRLLKQKQNKLIEKESSVDILKQECDMIRTKLNTILRPSLIQKSKEKSLLIEIGSLTGEIRKLEEQKSRSKKLEAKYKEREALQEELTRLGYEIDKLEKGQEKELKDKKYLLSKLTLNILHRDKDHEEVFRDGKYVEFDFGEDKVTVDKQALFSASSMVYLKNAFRLSILQASCIERSFLYPRFLLIDNVEDKGMQPERSHKFQENIISAVSDVSIPHQIIYTTSMIAPFLEGTEMCIGPYYTDTNKTLKV